MTLAPPEVRKAKATLAAHRKAIKKARPAKVIPTAEGQRQPRKRDNAYLQWIRRQPCAAARLGGCDGPVQAAHLRYSDAARGRVNPGLQQKPSDLLTTPLCAAHHAMQHAGAERLFWAVVGIDPALLCDQLRHAYEADGSEAPTTGAAKTAHEPKANGGTNP